MGDMKYKETSPWIKDGICTNNGKHICNIGYACDGCPYNIENIVRAALVKIKQDQVPVGKCLSYNDIALMIDNTISRKERKRIIEHICTCKKCCTLLMDGYGDLISPAGKRRTGGVNV